MLGTIMGTPIKMTNPAVFAIGQAHTAGNAAKIRPANDALANSQLCIPIGIFFVGAGMLMANQAIHPLFPHLGDRRVLPTIANMAGRTGFPV